MIDWKTMLKLSVEHARQTMAQHGKVKPVFLLLADGGRKTIAVPASFADDSDKRQMVQIVRAIAAVEDAEASVLLTEAWMATQPLPEGEDVASAAARAYARMPLRDRPDREEVLLISLCHRSRGRLVNQGATVPILRDAAGKPSLGEVKTHEPDNFSGRFTDLIAPRPLPEHTRAELRDALKTLGTSWEVSIVHPAGHA